jgi:anti-sigma-K factor RskA
MAAHEQFADDLALYALGALPEGDGKLALEKHLETCASCRRELELLRGDMGLLSLSTMGPAPPERSRQRLVSAIASEPRGVSSRSRAPHNRWWQIALPCIAAASFAIAAALLWNRDVDLKRQLAGVQSAFSDQQDELTRAREVVATLQAPDAQQVTLVAAKTLPQPHGKAFYRRGTGSLVFLASNLPPIPADKVYELWLIPATGNPVPAGVFRPDEHGGAAVLNPPLPQGVQAKSFAVTLEPASGSHETPSGQFVIVGAGE